MDFDELFAAAWFNAPAAGSEYEEYFDPETGEVVLVIVWTPDFEEEPEIDY